MGWTRSSLSALVMALMRSAVQADPARALCTISSLVFVSRDENEMNNDTESLKANGITHSGGRCDDKSIARSGPFTSRQQLDKHRMIPGLRDKAVSWLVETSCLPAQL